MNLHRIITTAAVAAVAGSAALAPAGNAADAVPEPKVTGAYAYLDTIAASKQKFVRVVFETASELPLRADGAIQAGVSIEGVNNSIGTAKRGRRATPARPRSRAARSPR